MKKLRTDKGLLRARTALGTLIIVAILCLVPTLLGYIPTPINIGLSRIGRADFLGTVLGVLVTLVGLATAGWFAAEQIYLERDERAKDRQLSAKREVLMRTIEGMNLMLSQIANLSILEQSSADCARAFGDGMSKAITGWAVAEAKTVAIFQRIVDETNMKFMSLSFERIPITQLHEKRLQLDTDMREEEDSCKRLRQMRREADLVSPGHNVVALDGLIEISINKKEKLKIQKDEVCSQLEAIHIPYLINCASVHRRLRNKFYIALGFIRKEIHVDTEEPRDLERFLIAAKPDDQSMIALFRKIFPHYDPLVLKLEAELNEDLRAMRQSLLTMSFDL